MSVLFAYVVGVLAVSAGAALVTGKRLRHMQPPVIERADSTRRATRDWPDR